MYHGLVWRVRRHPQACTAAPPMRLHGLGKECRDGSTRPRGGTRPRAGAAEGGATVGGGCCLELTPTTTAAPRLSSLYMQNGNDHRSRARSTVWGYFLSRRSAFAIPYPRGRISASAACSGVRLPARYGCVYSLPLDLHKVPTVRPYRSLGQAASAAPIRDRILSGGQEC
eukprot:SAG31_NODE_11380_length_1037_cov_0.934968_1_plen_170_part_00